MARRFVLLAHRVPVSGAFTLNDLAGGAGRMDEVARAVSTGFTISNDLRRDTEMVILLVAEPPPRARRIRIEGSRVRYLNPDERSTAALLKNALVRSALLAHDVESSPGLVVGPVDPAEALRGYARAPGAFWLAEGGVPLRAWSAPAGEFTAIVSDPTDPTPEEEEILRGAGIPRVSVGPRSLRTSQVVDLVHNEFDLREDGPPSGATPGSTPEEG